jgi:hypothetical protein
VRMGPASLVVWWAVGIMGRQLMCDVHKTVKIRSCEMGDMKL